jgi:hypothetical protein
MMSALSAMSDPLGLESKTVRLVAYDERWPSLFAMFRIEVAGTGASGTVPARSVT